MKKIFSGFILLGLVLGLFGCSQDTVKRDENAVKEESPVAETTEKLDSVSYGLVEDVPLSKSFINKIERMGARVEWAALDHKVPFDSEGSYHLRIISEETAPSRPSQNSNIAIQDYAIVEILILGKSGKRVYAVTNVAKVSENIIIISEKSTTLMEESPKAFSVKDASKFYNSISDQVISLVEEAMNEHEELSLQTVVESSSLKDQLSKSSDARLTIKLSEDEISLTINYESELSSERALSANKEVSLHFSSSGLFKYVSGVASAQEEEFDVSNVVGHFEFKNGRLVLDEVASRELVKGLIPANEKNSN